MSIGKPPYRRGSKKTTDFKVGILDGKPSIQVNWGGRIYGSPLSLLGSGNELATQRFGNLHASGYASFGSGVRVGPDSTSKSALRIESDGALSIGKKGATAAFSVTSAGVASYSGTVSVGGTPLTTGNTLNSNTNWSDVAGTANAPENNATADQTDAEIRSGTGWSHSSDATLIDGGDIYANSVTANAIATDTITANEIDGGTITINELATIANIALSGKINITSVGSQNVMLGKWASSDPDVAGVTDNVVIGTEAGKLMESGAEDNVIIGTTAGDAITTGKKNVAIGNNALSEMVSSQNCIAIGGGSLRDTTGLNNIGIGQAAGAHITTGTNNIAIGQETIENNVDVIGAIAIGKDAGGNFGGTGFMGNYSICIGQRADVGTDDDTESIVIGREAVGHGSNICVIGNTDMTAIHPADNIGVDLGSASFSFNNIYYDGGVLVSDRRLKEDITSLSLGLDFINNLNPVSFKKKDKEEVHNGDRKLQRAITHKRKHAGFIAQEVKEVMDDMNISTNDFAGYVDANVKEGVDKLLLRYEEFIAPIVKAVQELSVKLDNMDERLTNLEAV